MPVIARYLGEQPCDGAPFRTSSRSPLLASKTVDRATSVAKTTAEKGTSSLQVDHLPASSNASVEVAGVSLGIKVDEEGVAEMWLTTMALLVLLGATTWALFVAPHLAALGCIIKPALLRRPRRTIGTGAGRSMAFMPVSAFLSYDHDSSQDSVLRLGSLHDYATAWHK